MLYSYLFQKDITNCSWDIAHIYEHAFCHGFMKFLTNNNIDPSLFGWFDADTFEHSIFIFACFYNKKIANLFEKFVKMNNIPDIPLTILLKEIGAEEKAIFTISDQKKLQEQLSTINKASWVNIDSTNGIRSIVESQSIESPLKKAPSTKSYRKVIISSNIKDGSDIDKILFLRWSSFIADIMTRSMHDVAPCSFFGSSPVIADEEKCLFRLEAATFPKNVSLVTIKKAAQDAIDNFDIEKNFEYIKDHFVEFSKYPTWRNFSVEYFRHTGIITSTNYINSLATIDNLKSLNKKIKIEAKYYSEALGSKLY